MTSFHAFRIVCAVTVCTAVSTAAFGDKLLGQIDFPNSGAPEAQADFIEGVLYLHNFEYDEAQAAFERARTIDQDFAMAYWGEAMTYHHSLWDRQSRESALDVLRKLGRSPKARANKAPTQREQDLLHAVELLYGTVDETKRLTKDQRDVAYRDYMQSLHEKYPDDHEIATFYGLSILGAVKGGRDFGEYMRAAAELTGVWDENRMHPGAAHYLIHSYDDPVHAPLGLPMARAYSKIAPSAAHAQHMVSHIFVSMGMWDDLVSANEIAVRVENEGLDAEGERPITASHYVFWLLYGYVQQGRYDAAEALLQDAQARLENDPKQSERQYYGAMYTRYVLDTGDWDAAERWAAPDDVDMASPNYHFTQAVAHLMRGDTEAARAAADRVQPVEGRSEAVGNADTVKVLQKELEALFAQADGDHDAAIALAEEAAALEGEVPYEFGPPHVVKPAGELLGEILLAAGQHEDAVYAFEKQLKQTPLRTASLLGLARAAIEAGDEQTAQETYARLAEVWKHADAEVTALTEVKEATQDAKLGND
jgi:tetratricopeptide (TPR) repeat protein